MTGIRCLRPFLVMQFGIEGYVWSCCPSWTRVGPIGNLRDTDDVMDIWNSAPVRKIRRALLDGRLDRVCNVRYCPAAVENRVHSLDTSAVSDPNRVAILRQIQAGKTSLETPPMFINISDSGDCNLRCKMCRANGAYYQSDKKVGQKIFGSILPEILPRTSYITLSGNGDPFFRKETRELLTDKDNAKRYPHLRVQLITNALLLNRNMWERIKHNRFSDISVSVDAASKETYEKVRRNGNWETLRENLRLISGLRQSGHFPVFLLNFLLLRSNCHELKAFAELALELNCDRVVFQKVSGLLDVGENIHFTRNLDALSAVGKALLDPIFDNEKFNVSEIRDCRAFADLVPRPADRARTAAAEILFGAAARLYYSNRYLLAPAYSIWNRWKTAAHRESAP